MALRNTKISYTFGLPISIYMIVFFVVPSILLFVYSFWTAAHFVIKPDFVLDNYFEALASPVFQTLTFNAVKIGLASASICLLIAVPLAYYQVYVAKTQIVYFIVIMTWFASYLVRIYAWRSLLGTKGLINTFFLELGLIDAPLDALLFNSFAVTITLVHIWVPVATLMVMASFSDIPKELLDASRDLGAKPFRSFVNVVVPNASNGLLGAFMLTFILSAGDYVTPQMLGGTSGQTTGLMIANQFRKTGDWPSGAAMAIMMFVVAALLYFVLLQLGKITGLIPKKNVRA